MDIRISTHERNLLYDFFSQSTVVVDEFIEVPGEGKLYYKGTDVNISDPSAFVVASNMAVINFELIFPDDANMQKSSVYFGRWLHDRLSRRSLKKLLIGGAEIPIEENEIIKAVEKAAEDS